MKASRRPILAAFGAALLLAAGSEAAPPSKQEPPVAATPVAATFSAAIISAPAGRYEMDRNHATLEFRISHFGLSNYVVRFNKFDVALTLDPNDPSASSVTVNVDPTSVRTDFPGDYKALHPNSPFQSFDEDLAQSPKFFNAAQHPQMTFRSTKVEQLAPDKLRVTGDLTLLGATHPVTLGVRVIGAVAVHPFTKRGAIGFSASGTFNRSTFGLIHLLQPPLVGDAVTVQFDGEFNQRVAPAG